MDDQSHDEAQGTQRGARTNLARPDFMMRTKN